MISADVAAKAELLLPQDGLRERAVHGAKSKLVEALLARWIAEVTTPK